MRFSCRSALVDVVAGRQPKRLAVELDVEGANTRLLWIAAELADGGRIASARQWSAARWYSEAGFHPRYMLPRLEEAELVRWDGEDLVVLEYVAAHENRLRYLRFVQIPAMMQARGFDPTHYGGTARPSAPPSASTLGVGYDRVNCAKVLKAPTTDQSNCAVQLTSALNPDPLRTSELPDPPPSNPTSDPPGPPPRGSSPRQSHAAEPGGTIRGRGADAGPEGFEEWWVAMPVPRERQPRDPRVWPAWRERCLLLWVRQDLEGEADEILAELERRKGSDAWLRTPRYIPSGFNFLRAASWRAARRAPPPAKVNAPTVWQSGAASAGGVEVYEPVPWPAGGAAARAELDTFVRGLVKS